MRVAVLAHSFPRFPGDTHGPFVKHLSEALARRGHEMFALIPFDSELRPDAATPLDIRSFRYAWPDRAHVLGYSRTLKGDVGIKLGSLVLSPAYFLFAELALRRLVREQRIDLIHAHWLLPNGFVAARVGASYGVPVAMTLHGSDVFMAERNALFRRLARRAIRGARHITSCSPDLRDRLISLAGDVAAERILLVPNGTELTSSSTTGVAAMRQRIGGDAEDALMVAVGRLVDKKGFRYLIEAMPAVCAKVPHARLALGGGGDLEPTLRELAGRLGVADRVSFLGGLQHDEVLALIEAADVFVMPSVRDPKGNIDGLPIVVLEAMAAAKPVVATGIAGIPLAVADQETGLLVPERDPDALASALVSLLVDPTRAATLGAAGRRRIETELNWGEIAGRHDALYRAATAFV